MWFSRKNLLNIKKPNIENKELSNKKKELSNNKQNTNLKKKEEEKKKLLSEKRKREEEKEKIKKIKKEKKIISDEDEDEDSEYDSDYNESESQSSSSYSSSSSSEEEKIKKVKKKEKKKTTNSPKKKTKKKEEKKNSNKILKPKSILVYQLLKRWWYALPKWPPENYDCSDKLNEKKLRVVNLIDWKKESKFNENNFEKCFELPGFKYIFCDSQGKIYDFRPEENKPSFNNLMKLSDQKLYEYLIIALKKQIEILEKEEINTNNKELINDLKDELDKNERIYNRIKN